MSGYRDTSLIRNNSMLLEVGSKTSFDLERVGGEKVGGKTAFSR